MCVKKTIPVLIVAGFLGSGKTTLLNYLLANTAGIRIGVVVNDFGSINIDSMFVAGQVNAMVSLSNGCLCCIADSEEMDSMLDALANKKSDIDVIVIEASGLADPRSMIRLVLGSKNPNIAYGGLVQVVDAAEFSSTRVRHPELNQHIQLADLIMLNKIDRITEQQKDILTAEVRKLNSRSPLLCTVHAHCDFELLFDPPKIKKNIGPEQLSIDSLFAEEHGHAHCHEHQHLHSRYQSIDFTTEKPVHPRKLVDFLDNQTSGIYRIKGIVNFALAGYSQKFTLNTVGDYISFSQSRWSKNEKICTQLVVIGLEINTEEIYSSLQECINELPSETNVSEMLPVLRSLSTR
ncbi:MAG: CobW family GTP-binding protein [Mycobacteriaceae bacterium]